MDKYPMLLPSWEHPVAYSQLRRIYQSASRTALANRGWRKWDGAVVSLHEREGVLFVCWRNISDRVNFGKAIKTGWNAEGEYAPVLHWLKGASPPANEVW